MLRFWDIGLNGRTVGGFRLGRDFIFGFMKVCRGRVVGRFIGEERFCGGEIVCFFIY